MPRATAEWIASSHNAKVPDRVKLRIWQRQEGICGLSNTPINPGDPKHLHHKLALILGGEHRESNLVWVHARLNAEEAKEEVAIRAKNDARAKRHVGIGKKSDLAGRDREAIDADKRERSAAVQTKGKLAVPARRLPPGFVSAGDPR